MGEYLQLVAEGLTDSQLRALIAKELADHPGLVRTLSVDQQTVSTKLATCEHVFFTFEEMAALFRFVRRHPGLLRYGPNHDFNATPEDILRDRASLYLGPPRTNAARPATRAVSLESARGIEHNEVWRRTKRTLSRNGRWYWRKLRRDETSGAPGNPNGYRVTCKNTGRSFRATKEGSAWDASTNKGRDIYSCPACHCLFNLGEMPTPHLSDLAAELLRPREPRNPPEYGQPGAAPQGERLPATEVPGAVVPHE